MRYPINVSKALREAGKSTMSEKLVFFAFMGLIANIVVFSQLGTLLGGVGIPTFLIVLGQLIITLLVGTVVVRRFVIREDDKLEEHEKSKDTSLSNYYFIRNREGQEHIESVPVHEYADGNKAIFIRFTYGAATDRSSEETRLILTYLCQITLRYGLEFRMINMPELFEESIECRTMLRNIGNSKHEELSKFMLDQAMFILETCKVSGGLESTIVIIRTKTAIQIDSIAPIIRKLSEEFFRRDHSLRGMQFLDRPALNSLLRDYYCLEALDLAGLKTASVNRNTLIKYRDAIKVVEKEMKNGATKSRLDLNLYTGGVRVND